MVDRVLRNQQEASNGGGPRKLLSVEATLMTPVQPMLVRATLMLIIIIMSVIIAESFELFCAFILLGRSLQVNRVRHEEMS